MKTHILVTVLLTLLCTLAKAQRIATQLVAAPAYTPWVKHYGPEEGLAHREVNAIFQDRQEFKKY